MQDSNNLKEAIRLFEDIISGYIYHTKKMDDNAKNCFKYFYTIIKSDYIINDKVIKFLEAICYENDLDITINLNYSYTLASISLKKSSIKMRTLTKE